MTQAVRLWSTLAATRSQSKTSLLEQDDLGALFCVREMTAAEKNAGNFVDSNPMLSVGWPLFLLAAYRGYAKVCEFLLQDPE